MNYRRNYTKDVSYCISSKQWQKGHGWSTERYHHHTRTWKQALAYINDQQRNPYAFGVTYFISKEVSTKTTLWKKTYKPKRPAGYGELGFELVN